MPACRVCLFAVCALLLGQLILLPGHGDGTCSPKMAIADVSSAALAAAGLNRDGYLDLLVGAVSNVSSSGAVEAFLAAIGAGNMVWVLLNATGH